MVVIPLCGPVSALHRQLQRLSMAAKGQPKTGRRAKGQPNTGRAAKGQPKTGLTAVGQPNTGRAAKNPAKQKPGGPCSCGSTESCKWYKGPHVLRARKGGPAGRSVHTQVAVH